MLKIGIAFVIGTILCSLKLQVHALKATKEWNGDFYTVGRPSIVNSRDRLFTIFIDKNVLLNITSIDGSDISETCAIPLAADSVGGFIVRPVALGNGKIIVPTYLEQPKYSVKEIQLLIIVDPLDCSSTKTIKFSDYWLYGFAHVVPYYDSFDYFYQPQHIKNMTSKCRYNDEGQLLTRDHPSSLKNSILAFRLQTIKPFNESKGYFSIRMIMHEVAAITRLNSQYEIVKEVNMKPGIVTSSLIHGNVTYCYVSKNDNKRDLICEFLNNDLEPRFIVHVPDYKFTKDDIGPEVTNLPGGGAILHVISKNETTIQSNYRVIDANGNIREDTKIRTLLTGLQLNPKRVALSNGEFCLIHKRRYFERCPTNLYLESPSQLRTLCVDTVN